MADRLDGIELPARAIVRSSRADAQGYSATVEVLTGDGEPTGQLLSDLPLDRQWLGRDGAGWYGPPAPGRIMQVTWQGGSGGHPVVTSAAEDEPPVPAASVPQGGWAWQDGQGAELRQHPDGSWWLRNRAGAEVAVDVAGLWRVASTAETLHAVCQELLDTLIAAMTIPAAIGTPLPFNPATIAKLTALKARVDLLLRP